jgi:anti-sigma factor RsiW
MVSASSSSSEMACGETRRQLVDYMEGELERAAAARLLKHLESCPQCEAVLRGIQNVTGLLGQLVEFELAAEFQLGSRFWDEQKDFDS